VRDRVAERFAADAWTVVPHIAVRLLRGGSTWPRWSTG